jgi:hypothetical protein
VSAATPSIIRIHFVSKLSAHLAKLRIKTPISNNNLRRILGERLLREEGQELESKLKSRKAMGVW